MTTLAGLYTTLTGGAAGALDAESIGSLSEGDPSFVSVGGVLFYYLFDAASALDEASPDVIKPDDAGSSPGRHILQQVLAPRIGGRTVEIIAAGNTGFGQAGNIQLRAYAGALAIEQSDGAGKWLEGPVIKEFI